jgi:hypothetical protein
VTRFEEGLITVYCDLPETHIVNTDESMRLLFWQTRMTVTDTGMEASKIEID